MSYQYLMRHPQALRKAIESCQISANSSCDEVERAERDFEALARERVDDPEAFGQKVMQEQQTLVKLLQDCQTVAADPAKVKLAQEAYQAQEFKTKMLYAVIVATSQGDLAKE